MLDLRSRESSPAPSRRYRIALALGSRELSDYKGNSETTRFAEDLRRVQNGRWREVRFATDERSGE